MLSDLLDVDLGGLPLRRDEPIDAPDHARYAAWISRRAAREPAQYITGTVDFRGLALSIDARALIPRPETEGLVEAALAIGPPPGASVLDAGTGSGAIAIALACARPDLAVTAIDRSADAIALARENVVRHGVEERVRLVEAAFDAIPTAWESSFDLVVANPPYVPEPEWRALQAEVRDHEPRIALVPGPTGLEAYEALADASRRLLKPRGAIVLEVGYNQADRVSALLEERGLVDVRASADFAGIPRYVLGRSRGRP